MDLKHTERAFESARRFMRLVPLIVLLNGCSTSMSSISDPNAPLTSSEGIVIGSVLVRVGKTHYATAVSVAPFFLVSAQSIRYSLEGGASRDTRSIMEKPITLERDFLLDVVPGEERVFVTKMPAGAHAFHRLVPKGYEEAAAALGIVFTVTPGRATYIGRIIFDLPEKLPLSKGLPQGSYSLQFTIKVEDAQEATITAIQSANGPYARPVVKDLIQP